MEEKRRIRQLKYSDIDLSRWKDYSDILTDSWWNLGSRKRSNGHKLEYHGNFIPQIATQVFQRYTKKNEIVVDWFLGSGTSAVEAVNQERRLVGVELKPDLVEHVRQKIPQELRDTHIRCIVGDSSAPTTGEKVKQALSEMGADNAQLAVLHPPYDDIIRFSDSPEDLSNCSDTDAFLDGFQRVAQNAHDTLEEGRFAVLVIGDKYEKGELVPLGFKCMERMNKVGFKTKSIIVKNIEGNEVGKGKTNNLWRYRALAGGFYIFKHEYVMIFFK